MSSSRPVRKVAKRVKIMKKKIDLPIFVEGKYDKNTIVQIFDASVIYVGGFSIFNAKEKQSLIKKLGANGAIILTDSDAGGRQIRNFLCSILPRDKVYNAYIPQIAGKEKRKRVPSKQGYLGVEGMSREQLERALSPFVTDGGRVEFSERNDRKLVTKIDMFLDKLSGCNSASARRAELAKRLELPTDMTANALLEAINMLIDYDEYKRIVGSIPL